MFRRAPVSQRGKISQSTRELVPRVGDRVEWVTPLIGKFTLENLNIRRRANISPPYYELRAGLRIDPDTQRFPYELFMFHRGGEILGVVSILAQTAYNEEAAEEFKAATDFQISNNLIAPNTEDYNKLERYLKHGKMDIV